MNTNDYQGTCSVFQLDPSKILRNSMASSDTLDTLDTQDTGSVFKLKCVILFVNSYIKKKKNNFNFSDESDFSFTSSMLENLDEALRENEKKVCFNPNVQFNSN